MLPHLTLGAPAAALGSMGALALIPPAIAAALVVLIAYAWLRRRGWRRPMRRPAQPGESELLRLYERVQRRLGTRRAPPETPLEYEARMNVEMLGEITEAVNEGVYAGRWLNPKKVQELAERLS